MKRKETNKAKVLNYLKTGHTLDNAKAMAMFGYFRLSMAIHSLREDGHPIATGIFKGPEGNTLSYYRHLEPGMDVVVKSVDEFDGRRGKVVGFTESKVYPVRVRLDKTATREVTTINFMPTELVLVQ